MKDMVQKIAVTVLSSILMMALTHKIDVTNADEMRSNLEYIVQQVVKQNVCE